MISMDVFPDWAVIPGLFVFSFILCITLLMRQNDRKAAERHAAEQPRAEQKTKASIVEDYAGFRLNVPSDGGCRRGYCYACGLKIGVHPEKEQPTLERGDTFWFCSTFCYKRMLWPYVPRGYRWDYGDGSGKTTIFYWEGEDIEAIRRKHQAEVDLYYLKQKDYLREAVPKLIAHLEEVERNEKTLAPLREKEIRASYRYPDPPAEWQASADPPIIRSIKKPSPDRCIHCGTPDKSAESISVEGTSFWYCGGKCAVDTIKDFVPERWLNEPSEDIEFSEYLAALRERDMLPPHIIPPYIWYPLEVRMQWERCRCKAWDGAHDNVENRLRAEARKQETEEAEKEAEVQQRQWERDYLAADKEHEQFLADEAFQEALKPKPIPQRIRFEHTHILGPSGSGKTSLIQQLILEDIRTLDPLPAYVVIDPKGLMVERLSRLNIKQNIIYIDPTNYPLPALDLFHQPELNINEHQRNRVRNQLIETFAYIFSTANARLTQRQSIPFSYVVRLVFFMGGNIDTLMDILEDDGKQRRFYPYMQQLGERDSGARRFFENDFYSTGFGETRQQIKTRLYEILSKPELIAMFAAGQNKLSIFDCLQQRKMVLTARLEGLPASRPLLYSRRAQCGIRSRRYPEVAMDAGIPHHRRVSGLRRRGKDAGATTARPRVQSRRRTRSSKHVLRGTE